MRSMKPFRRIRHDVTPSCATVGRRPSSIACWRPCVLRCRVELLKGEFMERDIVCGMQVDPAKAAGKSEHSGKTYYFCSPVCKKKFDASPDQYTK